MFYAKFTDDRTFSTPITKVVCVGRNYAEHAKELNNPVPDEPILFIKPESSLADMHRPLRVPAEDCHYETELAVLIGEELQDASLAEVERAIAGYGLALDLTRRQLQSQLKAKSHPWEIAKAFDGACPLSQFVAPSEVGESAHISFSLLINGALKQQGMTEDMLMPVIPLIQYMSRIFTLRAGDVVLTGTPKGVGQLSVGDHLQLQLANCLNIETQVVAR